MILKKHVKQLFFIAIITMNVFIVCGQLFSNSTTKVIYEDNFMVERKLWIAEFEKPSTSSMKIGQGKLRSSPLPEVHYGTNTKLQGKIAKL